MAKATKEWKPSQTGRDKGDSSKRAHKMRSADSMTTAIQKMAQIKRMSRMKMMIHTDV